MVDIALNDRILGKGAELVVTERRHRLIALKANGNIQVKSPFLDYFERSFMAARFVLSLATGASRMGIVGEDANCLND